MKKIIFTLIAVCLGLTVVLSAMEVIVRLNRNVRSTGKWTLSLTKEPSHPVFGWEGNYFFGNPATAKKKVFFVGDSFTNGAGVPGRSLYFHIFSKLMNCEEFVYGGGGYGTLQEFLVIDHYFDRIKPDVVVLQVCSNDFCDNSLELGKKYFINNFPAVRPYLINNKIVYGFPRNGGALRVWLSAHSSLSRIVFYGLDQLLYRLTVLGWLPDITKTIKKEGHALPEYQRAVDTTDAIIKKIKVRIGNTPIVAFAVDDQRPFLDDFRQIFKENGIPFIEDVPRVINEAAAKGTVVTIKDGSHWNEVGHLLCAQTLAQRFRQLYK